MTIATLSACSFPELPELPEVAIDGSVVDASPELLGTAALTWSTLTADATGRAVAAACPAGATSAVIYAQPDGAATPPFEDRVPCNQGSLVQELPAGRYTIWVRLADDAVVTRFAESTSQVVDVQRGLTTAVPTYDIFVDHGFYRLSWNLRPPGSAGPVPCSTIAGEDGVSILLTDGGGAAFETLVDCEAGLAPSTAVTRPLPAGLGGSSPAYAISVALLNRSRQSIANGNPIAPAQAGRLDYGNKYQDVGPVNIDQNW